MIEFELTDEDIKKGIPRDPELCAFARAIKRVTGKKVNVGTYATVVGVGQVMADFYVNPDEMTETIQDLDWQRNVKGRKFTLRQSA